MDTKLPPLREDIALHRGRRGNGGAPTIVLFDPASNAYYQLGWLEHEAVARWPLGTPQAIADAIASDTTLRPSAGDIETLARFLASNGLVRAGAAQVAEQSRALTARSWASSFAAMLGALLFRRIPLLAPQAMLERTLPFARPFFTRAFLAAMVAALLLALHLVSQEWTAFRAGFAQIASPAAIAGILLALALGKSLHELAHAYATVRHGGEVTSMGVMLIILWPVLYTETSSAWTMAERRKRIEIAAAGVAAEAALAAVALLLWPIAEPGPLRSSLQFAATTLLALSLAVNLNPLMRFDGYFVLCELLGIENLHGRAAAMLTAVARRVLAGHTSPPAEPMLSRVGRAGLAFFGAALLAYRVVLYGGIALMLTYILFPAAALPLAVAIVLAFLLLPLLREAATWVKLACAAKGRIAGILRVSLAIAPVALLLAVPWRSTIAVPAIIGRGVDEVFPPEPAMIEAVLVSEGASVAAGTPLVRLTSPDLAQRLEALRNRATAVLRSIELKRGRSDFHETLAVRAAELAELEDEIAGIEARFLRFDLRATRDGVVTDIAPGLAAGRWVAREEAIVRIAPGATLEATAYADERDIASLEPGATAELVLDGLPTASIRARVEATHADAIDVLDAPVLASPAGGPVTVTPDGDRLIPEVALYKVRLSIAPDAALPAIETRGLALIETRPRSFLSRIIERVIGLWRREIG